MSHWIVNTFVVGNTGTVGHPSVYAPFAKCCQLGAVAQHEQDRGYFCPMEDPSVYVTFAKYCQLGAVAQHDRFL